MLDVIIAGAGPAGSIAAIVLARAGARVLVVDRETFPRDKLCGDTLNPGALRVLDTLGLRGGPLLHAWPLAGMRVTGPGTEVTASYPPGQVGLAVSRRDLDAWLLAEAERAGAKCEQGLAVRRALMSDGRHGDAVRGVVVTPPGRPSAELRLPARLTIAADGRRSILARSLGLSLTSQAPRRWAFGVYATGVPGLASHGEMHIRGKRYIGVAPLSASIANICVVTPPRPAGRTPADVIRAAIAADADLRERLSDVQFVDRVRVLGPLASDVRRPGMCGLLMAGDACGFVDPMTGDGLTIAIRGALLAAGEALRALESGDLAGAPERLDAARRRELGGKLRFNRLVRGLVERPAAVNAASIGARGWPGLVRRAICYAGDAR